MKKFVILIVLFCLAISAAFGQKRKTPAKSVLKKQPVAVVPAAEISDREWSAIADALDREDWMQGAMLSKFALGKLKADNDKKQLARLRYFYLYALAGNAASGKITYAELEKAATNFIGKEFLMPSRQILNSCQGKVNYICPVGGSEKALRVTATDKAGATIHSFEYVKLTEKFDAAGGEGQTAFVGGTLEKVEINAYKSNLRIMRLFFDRGFVNIVSSR